MNSTDYFRGQMAAGFAHDRAIVEWKCYANELEAQLQNSELKFVQAETGRISFAYLFRTVLDELKRVDPNNPLVNRENQIKIFNAKVVEEASKMGYVYDVASGKVVGKQG